MIDGFNTDQQFAVKAMLHQISTEQEYPIFVDEPREDDWEDV